jgi:recombination protein RecT
VRAYAPEIAMGLPTADELADVIDVNADGSYTISTEELRGADTATRPAEIVDQGTGEIVPSYEDLLAQIQKADSVDVLEMVMDSARGLPESDAIKLSQAYDDRREILLGA